MKSSTEEMTTPVQVVDRLKKNGNDNEFRFKNGGLAIGDDGKVYQPEDLKIVKTYRFEGDSNPSDMAVLYIIKTNDNVLGYSLDAYGVYSSHDDDEGYDNVIRMIPVANREEQLLFEV